jgi:transposase-like protein
MLNIDDLFEGRHFDREIVVLCVRWYLRYKLSFRDLVEMMAERGLSLAHTTVIRWIQLCTRIRETLESFRSPGGTVLARR